MFEIWLLVQVLLFWGPVSEFNSIPAIEALFFTVVMTGKPLHVWRNSLFSLIMAVQGARYTRYWESWQMTTYTSNVVTNIIPFTIKTSIV